ncbi:AAA family ATPase [Lacticaseibacillus saniviri]|uniref:AAA family ATPase n=1 Tax=Lacticaseibacillus saniviri TaxID=931533 RepID=UPI001EE063C1|nr:SMC family ATPase [Lacticaseibacillus saniviri]MCG4281956.1 SMC family ATPase [Lacticaseibacillus saniviri]
MRFTKLHLQYFGPYRDTTIDFTEFSEAPVFLISGQTGSGKTTIFDALVYALYGKTAGEERDGSEMRSKFATASDHTAVTLMFDHQELTYQLTRQPEQWVAKKRGDGLTKRPAKVELSVMRDGQEIDAFTKANTVAKEISDILPLDDTQFRQIVLLPQGDFRKFLDANSNDKEKLLRDLFGTGIYDQWTQALKQQAKNQQAASAKQLTRAELLRDQFNWAEAPDQTVPLADVAPLMTDELEQQQQTVTTLTATATAKALTLKNAQHALQDGQQLQAAFVERDQAKHQLAELDAQAETIQAQQARVDQLLAVERHRGQYEQRQQAQQEQTSLTQAIAQTQATYEQAQKRQAELQATQQQLADQADARQAQETRLTQLQQTQQAYQAVQTETAHVAELTQHRTTLQQQATQNADQQQATQQAIEATQAALTALQLPNQEATLQAQTLFVAQWQQQYRDLAAGVDQLDTLAQRQATTITALEAAKSALKKADQHYQELRDIQLRAQIASLVDQLSPNSPCPVCGSLDHPHPAVVAEAAVTQAEVDAADHERQAAQTQVTTMTTSLDSIAQEMATLQESQTARERALTTAQDEQADLFAFTSDLQLAPLNRQLKATEKTVSDVRQQHTELTATLADLTSKLNGLQTDAAQLQTKLATLDRDLAEATTTLTMHRENLPDLGRTLPEIESELDQVSQDVTAAKLAVTTNQNDLADVSVTLAETKATLAQQQERHTALQTQIAQLTADFDRALADAQIDSDDFVALLAQLPELPTMQQQLQAYHDQQVQLTTQLEQAVKRIADREPVDLASMQQALDDADAAQQSAQQALYQAQEQLRHDTQTAKELAALMAEQLSAMAAAAELQGLIDVMAGTGQQKISLERYVLQTYLQQVLTVANQRLSVLTQSRYQFVLHTEAGSLRNHSGLEIDVYDDQIGETRSVHTLSGGESFIAALSLALALGEVIQEESGGIHIDALFVDEGFGSLDTDSLAIALEALETIEGQDRLIGIISHVNELRTGIRDQLNVEPVGDGTSRVRVRHLI